MPTKYFALNKSNTIANLKYLPSNTCFLSLKSTTMADRNTFLCRQSIYFFFYHSKISNHICCWNFNYFQHSISLIVEKFYWRAWQHKLTLTELQLNCLLKTMCDSATWLFLEIKLFKTIYIWIYLETKTTPALELKLQ